MLDSILVIVALFAGSVSGQAPKSPETCEGVEATLRVMPSTFRRGTQPRFAVVIKNISDSPLRLLDVRDGRRRCVL